MSVISLKTSKRRGTTILKVNGQRLCFLSIKDALNAANRIKEIYRSNLTNEELNSYHPFALRAIAHSKRTKKERCFSFANV